MHGKHPIFEAMLASDYETLGKILDAKKMAEKIDGVEEPAEFAASNGLWSMLIWLCQKFPESDGRYHYGSVLLKAINAQETQAAIYLLRARASLKWQITNTGNQATHLAVIKKNRPVLEKLIEYKADFKMANLDNKKPVQLACNEDDSWDWELLEWLAKRIPDNDEDLGYGEALHDAAFENCTTQALMLMDIDGIVSNWYGGGDLVQNYPPHWAVHHKNLELFSAFVDADLNMDKVNKQNQTPLLMAAAQGFWEGVSYSLDYLEKSPNQKKPDWNYESVLVYAAKAGLIPLVKRLIAANMLEPWLQGTITVAADEETPMEACAKAGHLDCLQILLEADNYTQKDPQLAKKLHYDAVFIQVLEKGDVVLTKMLLERNASCNQRNREVGNIALYKAMEQGRDDLLRLLIKHKANPALENKQSQTSLDWAKKFNHPEWLLIFDPIKLAQPKPENQAKALHAMLKDREVKPHIMPGFLLNMLHCHQAILQADLKTLKEMRGNFQNQDRVKDLDLMIQCINQINHQQHDDFLINKLKPLASVFIEAKHILGIENFQKDVRRYAGQLKQRLISFQEMANQIPAPATGFFSSFLGVKPASISLLKQELHHLSTASACEGILSIVMQIMQIYSQPLEKTPENNQLQELFTLLSKTVTNADFHSLFEEELECGLFLENGPSVGC